MTRRSWILVLSAGLSVGFLPGCLTFLTGGGSSDPAVTALDPVLTPTLNPENASPYHAHRPDQRDDKNDVPFEQTHYPQNPGEAAPMPYEPPQPPPFPQPTAPPAPPAAARPPDPAPVGALRCLMDKRAPDALDLLQSYDKTSQDLLLALLPLAARVGEGGLDHVSAQEAATFVDQLRQLENQLRPRAALVIDKMSFCRRIDGFGGYEAWPEGHAFQPGVDGRPGERMQLYVEVRNFSSRVNGTQFETALASILEIRDFKNELVWRKDFQATLERSQTLRQDFFINFHFNLPPHIPEGRYTLRVQVKDALDSSPEGAARAAAPCSLDFYVASPAVRGKD